MSDPTLSCDALADELMAALHDHPANILTAAMYAQDGGRLQKAYNRLRDVVHGPARAALEATGPSE